MQREYILYFTYLWGHVYRKCIAIVEADLVVLELQDQDSIITLDVIDI